VHHSVQTDTDIHVQVHIMPAHGHVLGMEVHTVHVHAMADLRHRVMVQTDIHVQEHILQARLHVLRTKVHTVHCHVMAWQMCTTMSLFRLTFIPMQVHIMQVHGARAWYGGSHHARTCDTFMVWRCTSWNHNVHVLGPEADTTSCAGGASMTQASDSTASGCMCDPTDGRRAYKSPARRSNRRFIKPSKEVRAFGGGAFADVTGILNSLPMERIIDATSDARFYI
jgi:hypothetical protein